MNSTINNNSNIRPLFLAAAACTTLVATSFLDEQISNSCHLNQYSVNNTCVLKPTSIIPEVSLSFQRYHNIAPLKNYRELYKKVSQAKWYNEAYNNMSVGEVISIE